MEHSALVTISLYPYIISLFKLSFSWKHWKECQNFFMTIVVWPWNERPWKLAEKGRDDVSRKHYIPGNLQVFVRKYFKKRKTFYKKGGNLIHFSRYSTRNKFANTLVEIYEMIYTVFQFKTVLSKNQILGFDSDQQIDVNVLRSKTRILTILIV